MRNCVKKGWIALLITVVLSVLFATIWASDYFFHGIATGNLQKILVLVKLFIPTFLAIDWMLHMSFTASFRRKDAERFLLRVIQYMCAAGILVLGILRLKNRYMNWMPEAFENSHLFLKYALLLAIGMLPITDFRKWSFVWKDHYEFFWPLCKKVWMLIRKAAHGLFVFWNQVVKLLQKGKTVIYALTTVCVSFFMMETYTMNVFYDILPIRIFWNLVLYALIWLLLWILIRSAKWTSVVMVIFFTIAGIVNYYVILFRGNPVVFGDLTVVGTALSVANGFDYSIDKYFVAATLPAVVYLVLLFRVKQEKKERKEPVKKRKRIVTYILSVVVSYVVILGVCYAGVKTGFLYNRIEPLGWNLILQSNTNGYLLSFVADSTKSLVEEPEGYDIDEMCAYMDALSESFEEDTLNLGISLDEITKKREDADAQEPNIIVIMNESFSDLSVLGELETDVYYMPYVSSLTEDTIYGHLYVSPYGGNTVYSEFEFLTGNSMAFLPTGSIPYTQYIDTTTETPSLVSILENQSVPYKTIAIHPYDRSGYNRVDVYSSFGFDEFITIDDFSDYTIHRKFIQDEDDYAKVIETFENKEDGQPMFIFNITMQNHGGYGERTDYILDEPVHVTNFTVGIGVDEYLSSLKEADTAVETLIDYFSTVEEPTIIVFFGDHQPQLPTAFYDSIFGKDSTNLTFEETLQKHEVPFFIWSNYEDYGGQYVDAISTNYLSSILMELAGLNLTDYQKLLLTVHDEYPVITSVGAMDKDGNWKYADAFEGSDLLQTYEMMQYNYIFGDEERLNQYFYPVGE